MPAAVLEKKGPTIFERDQQPRVDTSEETLARLLPPFKESGLVTAGDDMHRHWRPLPDARCRSGVHLLGFRGSVTVSAAVPYVLFPSHCLLMARRDCPSSTLFLHAPRVLLSCP